MIGEMSFDTEIAQKMSSTHFREGISSVRYFVLYVYEPVASMW